MEEEKEGLTEQQTISRLQSGNYTTDEKKRVVSIGAALTNQTVKEGKSNFMLEQWFTCWRATRYGLPTSCLSDHAFEHHNHFFYDEDDPEFVRKIQTNKKIYSVWLRLCRGHGLKPELFEWLFVGPTRPLGDIQKVFGTVDNMNAFIKRAFYWFREASACG